MLIMKDIHEQLQSRERLMEWVAAMDLPEDMPAIANVYDNRSLFHNDNMKALQSCYGKRYYQNEQNA